MPLAEQILARLRDVRDFPVPGVLFKDITPLLGDARLFGACTAALADALRAQRPDVVLAVEARGFLVAAPVALALGAGLVPLRKPGKLPGPCIEASYALEYGAGRLEVHRDAIRPGQRVAVVDDLLATGGTGGAAARLAEGLGGQLVAFGFIVELGFLRGRAALPAVPVIALATVP